MIQDPSRGTRGDTTVRKEGTVDPDLVTTVEDADDPFLRNLESVLVPETTNTLVEQLMNDRDHAIGDVHLLHEDDVISTQTYQ